MASQETPHLRLSSFDKLILQRADNYSASDNNRGKSAHMYKLDLNSGIGTPGFVMDIELD